MDEYIEKHKAVNLLIELENEFQQFKPFKGFEHAMYRKLCEAEIAIGKLPAADVAPVVRCKDCKHKGWVLEPCHGRSVDYCKVWDCPLRNLETTFCSYGERKENNHEKV